MKRMKGREMIHLQINQGQYEAEEGMTILDVAGREGIKIPTLCHHEGLDASGSCRVCVVEISHADWKGWKGIVTSCLYPVEEGLEVVTDNEAVHSARRVVLDLLLARCPGAETIRTMAAQYGLSETSYRKNPTKTDCMLCTQCVRACEAKGAGAISTAGRGASKKISIPFGKPPADCIGCLSCAHICPNNVIRFEEQGGRRKIWGRTFEMAKCDSCGQVLMTEEQLKFESKKCGLAEEAFRLCPECKRSRLADRIDAAFAAGDQ